TGQGRPKTLGSLVQKLFSSCERGRSAAGSMVLIRPVESCGKDIFLKLPVGCKGKKIEKKS
ncbi:MAG: hypothetical protein J6S27_01810, partial [Thermoguttaceae bacterium]|nr:hypothetical protein [Thermoguttaceae bacterium]